MMNVEQRRQLSRKFTYKIITTDLDEPYRTGEAVLGVAPSYEEISSRVTALLGTRNFSHLGISVDGDVCDMFIGEMAVITGEPVNDAATKLYRSSVLASDPERSPDSIAPIHGKVILFDEQVWSREIILRK